MNIFEEHPHEYKPYISIIFQDTPYLPDGRLVSLIVFLGTTIGFCLCIIASCLILDFKVVTSCCRKSEKVCESNIVVENKKLLLRFALTASSKVHVKRRLVGKIEEYI